VIDLWKSITVALEKPGKLMEFFLSYFVATLREFFNIN